jgi:hypothetical protein
MSKIARILVAQLAFATGSQRCRASTKTRSWAPVLDDPHTRTRAGVPQAAKDVLARMYKSRDATY